MSNAASRPTLGTYLRELCGDWFTGMCGALSVPFTAFAVLLRGPSRIVWGALAAVAFIVAGYRVWAKERSTRLREVDDLKSQVATLERKPYDEELGRQVSALIARLSAEGKTLLRHLLERGPIEVGRRFRLEIMQDAQDVQLSLMFESGIVRHHQHWLQNGHLIRTDYVISEQFRGVLEDLLYPKA